jgi:hypothetical protein
MTLNATVAAADADSYFTIAEADAYFTGRGVTAWTGADAVKEIAARVGTAYLDRAYNGRWVGSRTTQAQALAWPRTAQRGTFFDPGVGVLYDQDNFQIPSDVVPTQIKRAAMEAALLSLGGATLEPTLVRGGQIKSISKGVGPLQKSITYMDGAPAVDRYLPIENLLRGLVQSQGNVRLVRA